MRKNSIVRVPTIRLPIKGSLHLFTINYVWWLSSMNETGKLFTFRQFTGASGVNKLLEAFVSDILRFVSSCVHSSDMFNCRRCNVVRIH